MANKQTYEVYAEFSGGRVQSYGKGYTRKEAETIALQVVEYDCHEMGERIPRGHRSPHGTSWYIPGSIVNAVRE
jgi:hypothetical protein